MNNLMWKARVAKSRGNGSSAHGTKAPAFGGCLRTGQDVNRALPTRLQPRAPRKILPRAARKNQGSWWEMGNESCGLCASGSPRDPGLGRLQRPRGSSSGSGSRAEVRSQASLPPVLEPQSSALKNGVIIAPDRVGPRRKVKLHMECVQCQCQVPPNGVRLFTVRLLPPGTRR